MKITFLGTGSMQPTKERNLSAILFNYEAENILFDCGEGTQRQLKMKELKATKITRIFISHFHADHVLGLGGILRTLEANEYKETLFIYGPRGLEKFYNNLINSAYGGKGLKIKLIELKQGKVLETSKFIIEAIRLDHSVPSFGFAIIEKDKRKMNMEYLAKFGLTKHPLLGKLQEGRNITYEGKKITAKKATRIVPGRKLTIIWDTGYTENAIKLAKNSDMLICESTFSIEEKEKAKEYKHLTCEDAAKIAKKSKSKRLILTHFSQRYKDASILREQAKKTFTNVEAAEDFAEFYVEK